MSKFLIRCVVLFAVEILARSLYERRELETWRVHLDFSGFQTPLHTLKSAILSAKQSAIETSIFMATCWP
ncbi:uncharacterized protein FPRO_12000 [Fusarium proliferatum ET1]|uniref:Secreted protein n=1 Tax=Fusarium proliferatum (strain ET1) TaxID=1227346 RepID=A0A1L7W2M4_FUSPR|nr:uncharacterized protein FPRO_12000 [Fusarium proliferatum ET1]CZR46551.1 uncharacterized protein FPRO_12000 [Fusarium proliferatum ET1]